MNLCLIIADSHAGLKPGNYAIDKITIKVKEQNKPSSKINWFSGDIALTPPLNPGNTKQLMMKEMSNSTFTCPIAGFQNLEQIKGCEFIAESFILTTTWTHKIKPRII